MKWREREKNKDKFNTVKIKKVLVLEDKEFINDIYVEF